MIELNYPILCSDGKIGLIIKDYTSLNDCFGIQVPNEKDERLIPSNKIFEIGNKAFIELS